MMFSFNPCTSFKLLQKTCENLPGEKSHIKVKLVEVVSCNLGGSCKITVLKQLNYRQRKLCTFYGAFVILKNTSELHKNY